MNEQTGKVSWSELAMYGVAALAGAALGILGAMWVIGGVVARSPIFWFISRAAAVVAFLLLWLSTAWGISVSSKGLGGRISGAMAFAMHNVTSWLALGFAVVHGLSLLGDQVVTFSLPAILVPFASAYQPVLTGIGTLAMYAGVVVTAAFYLKKRLGYRTWRTLHGLSYAMFAAVTVHGVMLGSDTSSALMQAIYVVAGVSVVLLTVFRIMTARANRNHAARPRRAEPKPVA